MVNLKFEVGFGSVYTREFSLKKKTGENHLLVKAHTLKPNVFLQHIITVLSGHN